MLKLARGKFRRKIVPGKFWNCCSKRKKFKTLCTDRQKVCIVYWQAKSRISCCRISWSDANDFRLFFKQNVKTQLRLSCREPFLLCDELWSLHLRAACSTQKYHVIDSWDISRRLAHYDVLKIESRGCLPEIGQNLSNN